MEEAIQKAKTEGGGILVFFGPEGVIMMTVAIALDLVGLILLIFGLDDFFITDILGIFFIGGWILFRSGTMKVTKKAGAKMAKAAKWAKRVRWLRPLLIFAEFIPYVGALPCWILLVYSELKYG